MDELCQQISKCRVCEDKLEHSPRPVFVAHRNSKIVIIGQAPGAEVHASGVPWKDKSGDNLRDWLGVSNDDFYNSSNFAIVPMGFCYPGKGKSGDLPPRRECAPLWHDQLLAEMSYTKLTLLIGSFAQNYYLKGARKRSLTDRVRHYKDYLPQYMVLPHPSPRNNIWQSKNIWFKAEVLPFLKRKISSILE